MATSSWEKFKPEVFAKNKDNIDWKNYIVLELPSGTMYKIPRKVAETSVMIKNMLEETEQHDETRHYQKPMSAFSRSAALITSCLIPCNAGFAVGA